MRGLIRRAVLVAGGVILGAFVLFVFNQIVGLSDFAGRLHPGAGRAVFWALSILAGGSFAALVGVYVLRGRPLIPPADPTPEQAREYRGRLLRRLRSNRELRESGARLDSEADLPRALAALDALADAEIKRNAARIFVATAVSRNGKLDSLIVLALMTRMVWRVSAIYNQRPLLPEIVDLYANVAVSAFAAGQIEDLDIAGQIHDLITPAVTGSTLEMIPGFSGVASYISAAVVDGTANALMALRAGIIARNYLSFRADCPRGKGRSPSLEASRMLAEISSGAVRAIVAALARATGQGLEETFRKAGRAVSGAVGQTGRAFNAGVRGAAGAVGRAAANAAGAVAAKVRKAPGD